MNYYQPPLQQGEAAHLSVPQMPASLPYTQPYMALPYRSSGMVNFNHLASLQGVPQVTATSTQSFQPLPSPPTANEAPGQWQPSSNVQRATRRTRPTRFNPYASFDEGQSLPGRVYEPPSFHHPDPQGAVDPLTGPNPYLHSLINVNNAAANHYNPFPTSSSPSATGGPTYHFNDGIPNAGQASNVQWNGGIPSFQTTYSLPQPNLIQNTGNGAIIDENSQPAWQGSMGSEDVAVSLYLSQRSATYDDALRDLTNGYGDCSLGWGDLSEPPTSSDSFYDPTSESNTFQPLSMTQPLSTSAMGERDLGPFLLPTVPSIPQLPTFIPKEAPTVEQSQATTSQRPDNLMAKTAPSKRKRKASKRKRNGIHDEINLEKLEPPAHERWSERTEPNPHFDPSRKANAENPRMLTTFHCLRKGCTEEKKAIRSAFRHSNRYDHWGLEKAPCPRAAYGCMKGVNLNRMDTVAVHIRKDCKAFSSREERKLFFQANFSRSFETRSQRAKMGGLS